MLFQYQHITVKFQQPLRQTEKLMWIADCSILLLDFLIVNIKEWLMVLHVLLINTEKKIYWSDTLVYSKLHAVSNYRQCFPLK